MVMVQCIRVFVLEIRGYSGKNDDGGCSNLGKHCRGYIWGYVVHMELNSSRTIAIELGIQMFVVYREGHESISMVGAV
jgi:hypothetical protein